MKFVCVLVLALVCLLFFVGVSSADWAITGEAASGYGDGGGVVECSGTFSEGAGTLVTIACIVYKADQRTVVTSFQCQVEGGNFSGTSGWIQPVSGWCRVGLIYRVNGVNQPPVYGDYIPVDVP